MRLGVLTGGGDCPGLNAVLRSLVRRGVLESGHEFIGILNGYEGLIEADMTQPLTLSDVRGILPLGGTILGTSNKANPFQYAVRNKATGVIEERDLSHVAVEKFHALKLDGLIAIGGDGTLSIAHRLAEKGIPVVGCPKTIDNDLSGTDQTFGFDTAVGIISEAIDRLHSTAEAHARVMIVEIMGRNAGFLTLDGGLAGGADAILIPEIPYSVPSIVKKIQSRWTQRRPFSIIAISEGAFPRGGAQAVASAAQEIPGRGVVRLGGAGQALAHALAPHIEAEIRVTVLGHLQRGGSPSALDRVLATLYGAKVIDLVNQRKWNHMVCLHGQSVTDVPLSLTRKEKQVDVAGDKVRFARAIGIAFGDE
jgi:ATP-dependent phosphofructokinase / diphosphate-dependent phosphofructokinase